MTEDDSDQLRFNVSQLLREPTGATRRYSINAGEVDLDEGLIARNLQGGVRLLRTERGVLVTGFLEGDVEQSCVRCLELFNGHLEFDLEEEFLQTVQVMSGEGLDLAEEDEESELIDSEHILDLTNVVRQAVLLAMPMQPLCKEDCAGLCPTCGANLNEGPCECRPEEVASPWAKLTELLKDDNSERSES
jgi:uncharacterized protein